MEDHVDWRNLADFMAKSSSRQTFFEKFSRSAIEALPKNNLVSANPLIMLTGGLRTRSQMASALRQRHAHLLGLGRLSVIYPQLPLNLKTAKNTDFLAMPILEPSPDPPEWIPKIVGAGIGVAWYVVAIRRISLGRDAPYNVGAAGALVEMYFGSYYKTASSISILFFVFVAAMLLV